MFRKGVSDRDITYAFSFELESVVDFLKYGKEDGSMAQIFRVERTKNFTVMSNHHFKNKNLTLKAKGLLSLMLSLPDDWNYNMQGLATLSRDGIDSVRSAIKELEHHGYVERHRLRNEYGFYGDTEYIIREVPLGEEND